MNIIQKSHFVIGLLFLALFLLSGIYMMFNFPELYVGREEIRMMFRATHIYILMSALVNLMTGNYLRNNSVKSFVKFRRLASSLILVAPFLFFVAFILTRQLNRVPSSSISNFFMLKVFSNSRRRFLQHFHMRTDIFL